MCGSCKGNHCNASISKVSSATLECNHVLCLHCMVEALADQSAGHPVWTVVGCDSIINQFSWQRLRLRTETKRRKVAHEESVK
eukprot:scaffold245017_cov68-Attheya_sp.AAC.1